MGWATQIQWNAFGVIDWNPQVHWLYPRRFRLLAKELVLIRHFRRSESLLYRLDLHLLKRIISLVAGVEHASVCPVHFQTEESREVVQEQRRLTCHMLEGGDDRDDDVTSPQGTGTCLIANAKTVEYVFQKSGFGSGFGKQQRRIEQQKTGESVAPGLQQSASVKGFGSAFQSK